MPASLDGTQTAMLRSRRRFCWSGGLGKSLRRTRESVALYSRQAYLDMLLHRELSSGHWNIDDTLTKATIAFFSARRFASVGLRNILLADELPSGEERFRLLTQASEVFEH